MVRAAGGADVRHGASCGGDLAQVFSTPPERAQQRLSSEQLARLRERLAAGGVSLRDRPDFESGSPSCAACTSPTSPRWRITSRAFAAVVREVECPDNWQTSAWDGWSSYRPGTCGE